jgi:hypothetical protein
VSLLEIAGIAHSVYGDERGGLVWESSQATFPGVDLIDVELEPFETEAAHFFCRGDFSLIETLFVARGRMGWLEYEGQWVWVMCDIRIELEQTYDYDVSALSFTAVASDKFHGKPDDPRILFYCHGEFDPSGYGSCGFRATLEIDGWGQVTLVDGGVTQGSGNLYGRETKGFGLEVYSSISEEIGDWMGFGPPTVDETREAAEEAVEAVGDAYDSAVETVSDWFSDDEDEQASDDEQSSDEESDDSWW